VPPHSQPDVRVAPVGCLQGPRDYAGFQVDPARPGIALPGRSSGHLSTKTVLRTIDRLAEEAGIQEVSRRQKLSWKKVTPHILRHSHVVNALMAGVPVPMIQKQVGHKRLSTTEIYATVALAPGEGSVCLHGFGPVRKAKALKKEAQEPARRAKIAMTAAETLPEAGEKARKLKSQADNLKAEAETLKESARPEDLYVWVMEKVKPQKRQPVLSLLDGYMEREREGANVHLGNCGKMDKETARQKARAMKVAALAIKI
jgi:hypothetical protein